MTDTYSEQHRRECEARWVLSLPKDARKGYIERVREKRGAKAAAELADEVRRQWNMQKETKNGQEIVAEVLEGR